MPSTSLRDGPGSLCLHVEDVLITIKLPDYLRVYPRSGATGCGPMRGRDTSVRVQPCAGVYIVCVWWRGGVCDGGGGWSDGGQAGGRGVRPRGRVSATRPGPRPAHGWHAHITPTSQTPPPTYTRAGYGLRQGRLSLALSSLLA